MRSVQAILIAALTAGVLVAGNGVAAAMDDSSMSLEQRCEKEGQESGIIDPDQLNDYVENCVASSPTDSDDSGMNFDEDFMRNTDEESSMSNE